MMKDDTSDGTFQHPAKRPRRCNFQTCLPEMAQKYGAEIKSTKAVNTLNKTQCMKIQFPKRRFRSPFMSPSRKLDLSKFLDVEKIR
jgi:hypothetical protein